MKDDISEAEGKPYFDAIVVIPLEEEFSVIVEKFDILDDLSNEITIKFSARLFEADRSSGTDPKFLLVKQAVMGKAANCEAFHDCLSQYDTGLLVCIGIAAAISSDVAIGDVCYSGTIIDVQENAKIAEGADGKQNLALSSRFYSSPREITIPISRSRISPITKPSHNAWTEECLQQAQKLIPNPFTGRGGVSESVLAPVVREGAIVCGLVSASPTYNRDLKAIDRKILALETESGGMSIIAEQKNIAAISVRGISDYAGADKNKFEEETKNKARHVAVSNAASFLIRQFSSPFMADYLGKLRSRRSNIFGQLDLITSTPPDRIGALLLRLADESNEKLRDLAPGYALQARGYRLPVPRIRMQGRADTVGDPVDVRDAIRDTRVLILHIPREYPDYSLAWIISNDLVSVELNNMQTVPCVIEARSLQRPRRKVSEIAGEKLVEIEDSGEATIVYIVDDATFDSRSKMDFLKQQTENHPTAKFVILTRYRSGGDSVDEFARATAASSARICEISFREISHFIQKNFEMTPSASEVVALR